jgi:hypothetical protein
MLKRRQSQKFMKKPRQRRLRQEKSKLSRSQAMKKSTRLVTPPRRRLSKFQRAVRKRTTENRLAYQPFRRKLQNLLPLQITDQLQFSLQVLALPVLLARRTYPIHICLRRLQKCPLFLARPLRFFPLFTPRKVRRLSALGLG